jgi:hypothetical protein
MQDLSQLVRDYGDKDAEVIFNNVASIISGQVSGKTAERMSKMFGKRDQTKQSETIGRTNDSVNISRQKEEILPISKIETLSQGQFFGKVADTMKDKIQHKFFFAEIIRDSKQVEADMKKWKPLPIKRDFGEAAAERAVRNDEVATLRKHFRGIVLSRGIGYDEEELDIEINKLIVLTSQKQRKKIIEDAVKQARQQAYDSIMDGNYDRIVREVANIVKSELERIRRKSYESDPRITDPYFGL